MKAALLGLVFWAFSGRALAQDVRVEAELRGEALYQNHGIARLGGQKAKPTTGLEVQHAELTLKSQVAPELETAWGLDLLAKRGTALDYAYVTRWFVQHAVGVAAGQMRVMQGGWDNASYESYTAHAVGTYAKNLVYPETAPMIAITAKVAGEITLQVLNDKVAGVDAAASWNQTKHATWALGWHGEFGPITPLVDIGSYDNNKSRWVDAGIKTEMNGLTATLDLFNKNQVTRYVTTAGVARSKADVSTGMTLGAAYEIKGVATPWFYFSSFDDRQAEDDELTLRDREYNTSRDEAGQLVFDKWDDNGQVIGTGINLNALSKGWIPYLAVVNRSGKFEDDRNPAQGKEKSELLVRLGVLGSL